MTGCLLNLTNTFAPLQEKSLDAGAISLLEGNKMMKMLVNGIDLVLETFSLMAIAGTKGIELQMDFFVDLLNMSTECVSKINIKALLVL